MLTPADQRRSPSLDTPGLTINNLWWFAPQVVFFREDLPEKTPQKNLLYFFKLSSRTIPSPVSSFKKLSLKPRHTIYCYAMADPISIADLYTQLLSAEKSKKNWDGAQAPSQSRITRRKPRGPRHPGRGIFHPGHLMPPHQA
jgi:hypothetical protein